MNKNNKSELNDNVLLLILKNNNKINKHDYLKSETVY